MYAVKITNALFEVSSVKYAGLRGEIKSNPEKVIGWKKIESAEKWIESQKRFDYFFGAMNCDFEIIQL